MYEIPELSFPYAYEITLVGAGVALVGLTLATTKLFHPWWRRKRMRMEREQTINQQVASHIWETMRWMVKDKIITPEEGEMYIKRFANLVPLKELLPNEWPTLKEHLAEKHQTKEKTPTEPTSKSGMLARMTERLA